MISLSVIRRRKSAAVIAMTASVPSSHSAFVALVASRIESMIIWAVSRSGIGMLEQFETDVMYGALEQTSCGANKLFLKAELNMGGRI